MGSSRLESSGKSYWFWGIVLSLSLHGAILILALFWGLGTPKYSGEPQSIEGRLVSISELEGSGGSEVRPSQVEKKEPPSGSKREEPQKTEVKKEEAPKVVKEEKPKEENIEVSKPERRELPKEIKKEEPKKVEVKKEEPSKIKEEPKKNVVVLDSKEKQKEKRVSEKPKPTESPKTTSQKETQKKKEASFENIRRSVLEDMEKSVADKKRRSVIEDIEKSVEEEKRVAESDSYGEAGTQHNRGQIGRSGSGASSGMVTSLFIQRIREEIKSKWKIPQTINTDADLKTVVVFRIDESGKVYDVRVEEPSGNPAFDDFCVKAIYKAAPLTPPPPELLEMAKTEGVEVTFSP